MQNPTNLYLIDEDYRRRAAISHLLTSVSLHLEPFEDVADFTVHPPRHGIILVHDVGDRVARLEQYFARTGTWSPQIAYSEQPDTARIVDAMRAGAVDYVAWPIDPEAVANAVRRAVELDDPLRRARQRIYDARRQVEKLTGREKEVLSGVVVGLSNKSIADRLHISPRTVEIHRANMLTKLQARNSPDAVRIAVEAGIEF